MAGVPPQRFGRALRQGFSFLHNVRPISTPSLLARQHASRISGTKDAFSGLTAQLRLALAVDGSRDHGENPKSPAKVAP